MAIIRKYVAKVEDIKNPLEGIYTVTFSSEKKFKFSPGQFLHLAIDDYDGIGHWPNSRCFSMQSNPEEEKIKITYAAKGNFTNRMKNELFEGREIWLKMPYGNIFQRGHDQNNCVFIAGGTGITPFLSLFTDTLFSKYITPKLYYGIRTGNYNLFKQELVFAKIINSSFDISVVEEDKDGILDINLIYSANPRSIFFISGPPIMIKIFKNFLLSKNVPDTKILTDDWE